MPLVSAVAISRRIFNTQHRPIGALCRSEVGRSKLAEVGVWHEQVRLKAVLENYVPKLRVHPPYQTLAAGKWHGKVRSDFLLAKQASVPVP